MILDILLRLFHCAPNGHISRLAIDSTSKFPLWKLHFERRIHVERMLSIRRGQLNVNSILEIDEILMSCPEGFFDVVSQSFQYKNLLK